MSRKRIFRTALQAIVLLIVCLGIAQSVRKASVQLLQQRQELNDQANAKFEQAAEASDSIVRLQLTTEAGRLRAAAENFWKAAPGLLIAAGILYAVGMLPASWFWRQCLLSMDQHAPPLATHWAYFYGGLGKYFPGKAMVIVIRLASLQQYGVKKMATTITIFMETLTMMAVGGACAAVSLIVLNLDWRLTVLAIGLLLATFFPTFPPVLRLLIARLQPGVSEEILQSWTKRINVSLIVKGWLALTLTWFSFALSLLCVLKGIPVAETADVPLTELLLSSLGACALAVVLGFVSLLPGGAGVREVVLSTILAPVVGPAAALCAAIWLRVTWLVSELLLVAILAALRFARSRYVCFPLQSS